MTSQEIAAELRDCFTQMENCKAGTPSSVKIKLIGRVTTVIEQLQANEALCTQEVWDSMPETMRAVSMIMVMAFMLQTMQEGP